MVQIYLTISIQIYFVFENKHLQFKSKFDFVQETSW